MRILISGHTGQVARELQLALSEHELISLDRHAFDLAQPSSLRRTILREQPDLLINAAAHTAVDQAEQEQALAFTINAEAPGVMAVACAELGIPLIHYSTDYVFDGSKASPYSEDDTPNPLSVYGSSKLAGERAIADSDCDHLILRTSWVYSRHGRNFLLTMQRLLQEREQLNVVADQIGAPTWAGSIAGATAELIDAWQQGNRQWGTYHLTIGARPAGSASPRPLVIACAQAQSPAPNCSPFQPATTPRRLVAHSTRAWTAASWSAIGMCAYRVAESTGCLPCLGSEQDAPAHQ